MEDEERHWINAVESVKRSKENVVFTYSTVKSPQGEDNYICNAHHSSGKTRRSATCPTKSRAKQDVCRKILDEWGDFQS
ncbi:hypothetical protein EV182_006081 [Spiromyces aspiralis]|uniref:Uncharacterized protein n=1 Tax=Spiromyces aspiralis TaxID=68401 RepID=A0ACC1HD28_9FUNG|nr:hypothetical protein EV182_006081 [Spiromyces aspiralis]